jgi:GTPase
MFVDQAIIHVRSGKGGDGVVHFRREKYVPRGGPDGGDGGKGGNVLLEATTSMNTLVAFRHQLRLLGEDGKNGAKQNMTGRSGVDKIIFVPTGTIIYDHDSGQVLGDLIEPGQQLLVAKGGRGGRGNARFASSVNQAPRIAEKGEPPQEKNLRLELKLIADIGIIGVPNAGKSTLLSVVSNARPKIAPYPFTTIEPHLGVAELDDDTSIVMADIPGLIEGAHLGIGLGHDFLRHIQRTRVLIHLLDGLSADPSLDYAQINSELSLFDPMLGQKPQVVAINKIDLPDVQERLPELVASFKHRKLEVMTISAATGTNVRELLFKAYHLLQAAPPAVEVEEMPVYRADSDPNAFIISQTQDGWRVSGAAIERAASMTYWEEFQSIRRFQRIMEMLGIDAALRKAGIENGDTVHIGDFELEWQD